MIKEEEFAENAIQLANDMYDAGKDPKAIKRLEDQGCSRLTKDGAVLWVCRAFRLRLRKAR